MGDGIGAGEKEGDGLGDVPVNEKDTGVLIRRQEFASIGHAVQAINLAAAATNTPRIASDITPAGCGLE
jgi:hypothetical protein